LKKFLQAFRSGPAPDADRSTEDDVMPFSYTWDARSCARYHIPLGTLRDWEQGRTEPDQPTRAYLTLIARDPDHVNRTLNLRPS
jgi:hypothetical protein